jgi:hypothetical protein
LGPRKTLFGPGSSSNPATKGRMVTYGSGFVATASDAGGPGNYSGRRLMGSLWDLDKLIPLTD